jgi:hypothetical protein
MDQYIEKRADGSEVRWPGVRWHNPTDRVAKLDLTQPDAVVRGRDAAGALKLTPSPPWIVTIKPGETVVLPEHASWAIQSTQCQEPGCRATNKLYCRDPHHHKMVVGGLGPNLRRIDDDASIPAAEIHPALLAQSFHDPIAYTTSGPPRHGGSSADADARLMQRVRSARGGAQ